MRLAWEGHGGTGDDTEEVGDGQIHSSKCPVDESTSDGVEVG